MNVALTVLSVTAPVFLLALVGFVWVKLGFEYRVEFVTRLSMTLSVPCLIFVALMQTDIDPAALADLSLASLVAYLLIAVIFTGVVMLGALDRSTYLAPLIFGNTGNIGLPLALFAFGNEGLSYAVVVFAVMAILSFTVGILLVAGSGSVTRVLKEPMVAGTLLGALFLWQGWETPEFLTNTLELIGQMAIPLMLITLGVAIARLSVSRLAPAVLLSALKAAVCAGIGWAVALWFALPATAAAILVLQVTTPVAVTSYLIAEKYKADSETVAGLVIASTLLSVIFLPLILSIVI